jgi:tetratricopeptide (TPR) repeat protein
MSWLFTRGRSGATLFGIFWLIAFWIPVSGIIPFPSAPLADRYLYIPAIGLWIILADQVVRMMPSSSMHHRYGTLAFVFVLLALSAVTASRNLDWRNDLVLFSQYVEKNPERAFGHHNLGCAYLDKAGDLNAAESEFEKALILDPYFPHLRTQMGYIHLLQGDNWGAILHYNEAISQNPFDAEALLNCAIALDKMGRFEDAVTDYKRFLAVPDSELSLARPQAEVRLRELSQKDAVK